MCNVHRSAWWHMAVLVIVRVLYRPGMILELLLV